MPSHVIVMPSIRKLRLSFLDPVINKVDAVYVIDDSNGVAPRVIHPKVQYFDYGDQEDILGDDSWLIPRKNPSCKNFGLYMAYKEGAEVICILDDDCDLRINPGYFEQIPIGKSVPVMGYTNLSGWCNTLLTMEPYLGHHPRGYPYEHRFENSAIYCRSLFLKPKFNEGMWSGNPDINELDKSAVGPSSRDYEVVRRIYLDFGQKLPLSIMNVQFHRDLVPAFYQPPDFAVDGNYRIRRHDDVWSMYLLKKLMDKKQDYVTVGHPMVLHREDIKRPENRVISEHVTLQVQGQFTNAIDLVAPKVRIGSYAEMAAVLGKELADASTSLGTGFMQVVLRQYGERVMRWAELCDGTK